jgi:hypothetical protein
VKLKPLAEKAVAEVDPPGSEVARAAARGGGLHGHGGAEEVAMTLLPCVAPTTPTDPRCHSHQSVVLAGALIIWCFLVSMFRRERER